LPILDITVYVDERSLYKYTNFLSGISVSAFSSGEILWRIKKSDLNNHSPPFSENIFTGAPLPLSYESYTKKKKKHELCVCVCVMREGGGFDLSVPVGQIP
jgi:hypothetical protein